MYKNTPIYVPVRIYTHTILHNKEIIILYVVIWNRILLLLSLRTFSPTTLYYFFNSCVIYYAIHFEHRAVITAMQAMYTPS